MVSHLLKKKKKITFLSPYVMLSESASVVIYEIFCVVLFYVVNSIFTPDWRTHFQPTGNITTL